MVRGIYVHVYTMASSDEEDAVYHDAISTNVDSEAVSSNKIYKYWCAWSSVRGYSLKSAIVQDYSIDWIVTTFMFD